MLRSSHATQLDAERDLGTPALYADRTKRVGIIDIGSNSIRLVVFADLRRVPTPIFNEKVLCGLGRDLGKTGRLNPEGADLAIGNLVRFTRLASTMGVEKLQLIATAAVREAEDGAELAAEIERCCGMAVTIISGEEEARLAGGGVVAGAPNAHGVVGDLGGGSLELVELADGRLTNQATLPLGPLRLMADAEGDPKAARRIVDRELRRLDWLKTGMHSNIFAVGGSWRSLARIRMALDDYPVPVIHGYRISRRAINELTRLVARQSKPAIIKGVQLNQRRLETLPLAALVLRRLLVRVKPANVLFSAYGLREGWFYNQLSETERQQDPLLSSAIEFAQQGSRFGDLGRELFAWLGPLVGEQGLNNDRPGQDRLGQDRLGHDRLGQDRLGLAACYFSDLAWREHPDYRADYAMRYFFQRPYLAADHCERTFLAHAIAWRHGGTSSLEATSFLLEPEALLRAQAIGLALRLAYTLTAGIRSVMTQSGLERRGRRLHLRLPDERLAPSGDVVETQLSQLSKAFEKLHAAQTVADSGEAVN